ncbi:adhesion G-protein coupled receptor G5 isoform X2 [Marmota flaviventris]|uniref:adhesion G-protein coupled receptor G5 isoform X2 n=1 Tax=Marmota flaviventris TaxID=93162 RepID=UPI003A83CA71
MAPPRAQSRGALHSQVTQTSCMPAEGQLPRKCCGGPGRAWRGHGPGGSRGCYGERRSEGSAVRCGAWREAAGRQRGRAKRPGSSFQGRSYFWRDLATGHGWLQDPFRLPVLSDFSGQDLRQVEGLEQRLLNASFYGDNLTLETRTIQSLIFKLGCDFAGLALSSHTLEQVSQARVPHAMQFPAELTREACAARPRELRLICVYFFTTYFFQDESNSSLLNNYVLGAQLDHSHVDNLTEPVNISFWHNQSLEGYTLTCVFWKKGASKHHWGAWSPEGCRTEQPSPSQVLCHCNHLTYFAVLMQLSPAPLPEELQAPLEYLSLVGCSISVVASLLTIVLHLYARKPSDAVTHIHMNLQGSVLLLNVAFLLSATAAVAPVPGPACSALAATLHFGLLSCQTWTAIEGFNLYLLLGRVYNVYIRRYALKLGALGWGVPALLVLLLLTIESSVYGPRVIPISRSLENGTIVGNTSMCWLCSPVVHQVLVMGYSGVTSLFNLAVLAWALWALRRLWAQNRALSGQACRDAVTVLGLTVLLGTTWSLAFFSFGIFLLPQLFLFTIVNSLYGFFLFLWLFFQRCHSKAEAKAEMEAFSSSQMTQ